MGGQTRKKSFLSELFSIKIIRCSNQISENDEQEFVKKIKSILWNFFPPCLEAGKDSYCVNLVTSTISNFNELSPDGSNISLMMDSPDR